MSPAKLAAMGILTAIVALPTPAFALFCSNEGPIAAYTWTTENGERVQVPDTEAQADLDLSRLRQTGVDATAVERWNGCLRAFVRQNEGGEAMEFYDPGSLRRLQ